MFLMLVALTSCTVYDYDDDRPYYDGGYHQGRGYLADDGRYYPNDYAYRYQGRIYRNGVYCPACDLALVGAYYALGNPGYGRTNVYHKTVINKNTTVIKDKSKLKKLRKQNKKLRKQNRKLRNNKKSYRSNKKKNKRSYTNKKRSSKRKSYRKSRSTSRRRSRGKRR